MDNAKNMDERNIAAHFDEFLQQVPQTIAELWAAPGASDSADQLVEKFNKQHANANQPISAATSIVPMHMAALTPLVATTGSASFAHLFARRAHFRAIKEADFAYTSVGGIRDKKQERDFLRLNYGVAFLLFQGELNTSYDMLVKTKFRAYNNGWSKHAKESHTAWQTGTRSSSGSSKRRRSETQIER